MNLAELTLKLEERIQSEFLLIPMKNERKGYDLRVIIEGDDLELNLSEVNHGLMPFERIQKIFYEEKFDRSELGKVIRGQLISKYS